MARITINLECFLSLKQAIHDHRSTPAASCCRQTQSALVYLLLYNHRHHVTPPPLRPKMERVEHMIQALLGETYAEHNKNLF